MLAGCLLLLAGVAVTFGAIATTNSTAFLAGTAVAGAGFGLGFSGAFRMTVALAAPAQSAGLTTLPGYRKVSADTIIRPITSAQDAEATGHAPADADGENELDVGLTVGNHT